MATAPVGPRTGSSSKPSFSEVVNRLMVSGSSRGIFLASSPVRSSSIRIMDGSSWPSISSFKRLDSMEWYSKWVVIMSESLSSAGCWTGQKS